jgi:replication factor C subunit 3/5
LSRDQIRDRLIHVANEEHVKFTEDGMEAILSLSGGDMRRVLNLLQTTAMSYPEEVNESAVYLTSGAPLPSDLDAILKSLMNDSFVTAQGNITDLCKTKGYAMADILSDLTTIVSTLELPPGALAELLDGMSGVEYRLAYGTDEEIQCASLVGVFVKARNLLTVAS